MISRRLFVALGAGAMMASKLSWAADAFPSALDHILLGCNDLQRGIDFVEKQTGVRAVFGGVHPGRGTQNALLSLGKLHYLEIIAPDPKQSEVRQFQQIKDFTTPRLVTWAAHPGNLDEIAKKLSAAGIQFDGPRGGSRARPDGRMLNWKALGLEDRHGLIPFFIEWGADSPHPSADAPGGCRLESFFATDPDPDDLKKAYSSIGIEMKVERGAKSQLHAVVVGPKGKMEVSS
jgi:hypothetical protein